MVVVLLTSTVSGGAPGTSSPKSVGTTSVRPTQSATIGLFQPFDYSVIQPSTPIILNVGGGSVTAVQYALDDGSWIGLSFPYVINTSSWENGTHVVRTRAFDGSAVVGTRTFVFFLDPAAGWPPDVVPVDVILVGFPEDPAAIGSRLLSTYLAPVALTPGATEVHTFELRFAFSVRSASASYHDALLDAARGNATYTDGLQARLNRTNLIDQRDSNVPRDIFDSLVGYGIRSEWMESYVRANPPFPPRSALGFTFYVMNLSALDDPSSGVDHWFTRATRDPDTGVDEDWWRLEWDNDLNTPMGYAMSIFGGPNRTVFVDPTAYEWYSDWTYIWWAGGNDRAPYGLPYDETPIGARETYLAEILNDLIAGLGSVLPWGPPQEPTIELRTYVIDGSANLTAAELDWIYTPAVLRDYLEALLPFRTIRMNTTLTDISSMPLLRGVVDANTAYVGGRGQINGTAVWDHLYGNRTLYAPSQPGVLKVITAAFVYDNRSMTFEGREFTGLGGLGVSAIFLTTDRLFYANGTRQKGLTSIVAHEFGHSLGYDHQFGPNYRVDFVDGNMGYFRNELSFGAFWEDALYRVLLTGKLMALLQRLEGLGPTNLSSEFRSYYADYRALDFLAAHAGLAQVEAMLDDRVAPTADAGPDRTVPPGVTARLDGRSSTDNFHVVNYSWDFGDGSAAWSWDPTIDKAWAVEGTYAVTLTVYDAAGNAATDRVVVTVGNPAGVLLWILVAVVGAVLAASAVLVLRARRRRRAPPEA